MPLFFILSGIVFPEYSVTLPIKSYISKYAGRYIVPYFILTGINLLLCMLMAMASGSLGEVKIAHYCIGILYSRGTTQWMPNCSPLWFLTCLFIAMIIFRMILKCKQIYVRIVLIFMCGVLSALLDWYCVPKLPWNVDTALMAVPFIAAGYGIRWYSILKKCGISLKKMAILWITAVPAGAAAILYNGVMVNFDNNEYGNPLLMIIGAAGFLMPLLCLCSRLSDKHQNPMLHAISSLGRHTIFVMGFDYFAGSLAGLITARWYLFFLIKCMILVIGLVIWYRLIGVIKNRRVRGILSF